MTFSKMKKEELQEMALIEMTFTLLDERKASISFKELVAILQEKLKWSDEQMNERIAQFYTDLNIDGRFMSLSNSVWGLKVWYPFDQVEEEVLVMPKTKKKKGKKAVAEDELDDIEALEEELAIELEDDLVLDDEDEDEDEEDATVILAPIEMDDLEEEEETEDLSAVADLIEEIPEDDLDSDIAIEDDEETDEEADEISYEEAQEEEFEYVAPDEEER